MLVLTDCLIYRSGFAHQVDDTEAEAMSTVLIFVIVFALAYTNLRLYIVSQLIQRRSPFLLKYFGWCHLRNSMIASLRNSSNNESELRSSNQSILNIHDERLK